MPHVVDFCQSHGITEKKPTFSFSGTDSQLSFTSEFLVGLRDGIQPDAVQ